MFAFDLFLPSSPFLICLSFPCALIYFIHSDRLKTVLTSLLYLLKKKVPFLSPLPLGPGLSIRVICAEEPYICKDFAETNNILKIITDFSASVKKVRTTQIHEKI